MDRNQQTLLRTYVQTLGDLRAVTAHLPDHLPLIHTAATTEPGESANYPGCMVWVNDWSWKDVATGMYQEAANCMRVCEVWRSDWPDILNGAASPSLPKAQPWPAASPAISLPRPWREEYEQDQDESEDGHASFSAAKYMQSEIDELRAALKNLGYPAPTSA